MKHFNDEVKNAKIFKIFRIPNIFCKLQKKRLLKNDSYNQISITYNNFIF